jgi:hypothetical protein
MEKNYLKLTWERMKPIKRIKRLESEIFTVHLVTDVIETSLMDSIHRKMDYFDTDEHRKLGSVALCAEWLPFCRDRPL